MSELVDRAAAIVEKSALVAFSGWVWGASMGSLIAGTTVTAGLHLFGMRFQTTYGLLLRPAMGACPRSTFSSIRVIYDPEFDPERRSVYCQNHVSILDGPLACIAIKEPFCGVFNHWHFHVPGYGWVMRLSKGIPVYTKAKNRTEMIAREAHDRFHREKMSILVFPEAHRTLDGRVREFKTGVFRMARSVGAPVTPLAVRGMYGVNHKGTSLFRPGRIEAYVGKQHETAGLSDGELSALVAHIQGIVADWVERGVLPEKAAAEAARGA